MTAEPSIVGREHWTHKGSSRLFLWEKAAGASPGPLGTILFVHGSSMASTPTFDLQVPGRTSVEDLLDFFALLPNPDKQFAVMPGIAHASFHQKNFRIPYHLLHAFFSQPAPVYRGA